jgi:hypothetical protein
MLIERIRELLREQPFQPFRIQMADGRHFDVVHPEHLLLPPAGRLAMLWRPDGTPDGATNLIHLPLVTSVGILTVAEPRRRRSRRS